MLLWSERRRAPYGLNLKAVLYIDIAMMPPEKCRLYLENKPDEWRRRFSQEEKRSDRNVQFLNKIRNQINCDLKESTCVMFDLMIIAMASE